MSFIQFVKDNAVPEAFKATPPVTAVASGLTASDIATLLVIVYTIVQIAYLAWKWNKEYRNDKDRKP